MCCLLMIHAYDGRGWVGTGLQDYNKSTAEYRYKADTLQNN
jgi:hypothetical protein